MKLRWIVAGGVYLLGLVWNASAFTMPAYNRTSYVATVVEPVGDLYRYSYTVWNLSTPGLHGELGMVWPSIIGWEIPLNSPSDVWEVTFPATWNYRFLSADEYENLYGVPNPFNAPWVLQWYDAELSNPVNSEKMIVPEGFNAFFNDDEYEPYAEHFGFWSHLGPVDGPYAALWLDFFREIGDPPLPAGGTAGGTVPGIPYRRMPDSGASALMLMAIGLFGMGALRKLG
ncbi:MAG: hypothetical protein RMN51_11910 [Verrucomicrobiota bacterium]|nr:hypothetical protein [Limisphaera sp.]MDW8382795.1 hypothetical protein [Verrucomicrobiota bacterium]